MRRLSMTIMAMLFGIAIFYARPAYQGTTRVVQPDGSGVTIRLVGDEYLHYNITLDGYSLVRRDDGAYVYAQMNETGQLEATDLLAHDAVERTAKERDYLEKVGRLMPQPTEQMRQMLRLNRAARAPMFSQDRAARYDYSQFRGLVILVEYNDCSFRYDDYADIMEDMINADDYMGDDRTNFYSSGYVRCTGSIRDYYRDNSEGMFVPTFDVVGPVQVNRSQYYANGTQNSVQLMIDACAAADSQVDFSDYDVNNDGTVDMIYFIFAGLGSYIQGNDSRLLWPHQYDISYNRTIRKDGVKLGRYACSNELFGSTDWSVLEGIGTMCHEFSHVLGLPDFYDANYEEDGECVTPDTWSIMAGGADLNYGRTPCGFSLFERYALGFATPQVIDAAGSYSLEALHSSNTGYRLNTQVNKEFFLIENRQKTKWDAALPGHGMLIFRVDSTSNAVWNYNTVNNNSNHPYYELLRAGGVRSNSNSISAGTASDPFPGTRNVTAINNETSPNLKTWSGKLSNLAFRNIRESGGVITFDAYDVDVLTSISFTSDSYRLSIGSRLQLTTVQDPESASCTCVFTSDNEAVATVDANGMVTALSEGTCHITVTANGKLTDTCTVLVTQLTVAPDIASFIAMEEGIDVLLTLTNAQVLYAYSGDIYLRDASGSLLLSGTGLNVSKNDILNGCLLGRLAYSNLMPQFVPADADSSAEDVSISSGEAPLSVEVLVDDLTPDYYSNLVWVRGMTLVRDGGVFAVIGDRRVRLWNKFQIKSPRITLPSNIAGKYFEATAIYGTDVVNGNVIEELYLLTSPVEGDSPDGIHDMEAQEPLSAGVYNLQGQRVGEGYKGIVVENGKKILRK